MESLEGHQRVFTVNHQDKCYQLYESFSTGENLLLIDGQPTKAKITSWFDCYGDDNVIDQLYQVETEDQVFLCGHGKSKVYSIDKKSELLRNFGRRFMTNDGRHYSRTYFITESFDTL